MKSTASFGSRSGKNLAGLRAVRVNARVDLPANSDLFERDAERAVVQAAIKSLHANGLRSTNQSAAPLLSIDASVRTFFAPVTNKNVAAFRVETSLTEKGKLKRGGADTSAIVVSWFHPAEVKFSEVLSTTENSPAVLREVELQLEMFVSDWRVANGFADSADARGEGRDDLQMIDGIGPVVEKVLNGLGIKSYRDLSKLGNKGFESDREIILAELGKRIPRIDTLVLSDDALVFPGVDIPLPEIPAIDPEVPIAPPPVANSIKALNKLLDSWIKHAKELLEEVAAV